MKSEETLALMRSRRSIRNFLPDAVPQTDLDELFESAGFAPSNCNTQPWKVVVVSGEKASAVKSVLMQTIGKGDYQLDFPFDTEVYPADEKQRLFEVGELMYSAVGIGREDKEARQQFMAQNFNFFGAPQAAFFFVPEWSGVRGAADVGMYAQNVMLAMQAKGIGSCPQTFLSFNADAVRDALGVDASFKLLFGLSFGYYNAEEPINQIRTSREPVSSLVEFQN